MRMRRSDSPGAPTPAPPIISPRWSNLIAGALLGGATVVAFALADLALGGRVHVGTHLPLTIGALVTMVGPLGVTFPCWATVSLSARRSARAVRAGRQRS